MFVYLSKKIAIPNNTNLRCIAWDKENGSLACGGDDGLLKVLKLDSKGGSSQSSLTTNQTLEGHNGSVTAAVWNESNQRLTTSDQNGLIIVWMLHKGQWYEEMINNRNKSVVKGMAWNSDGQKICIAYEDGAVIVGSVDGNRLWGKDLKNLQLAGVIWSPDSKHLLFATSSGEIHVHDSSGIFVSKLAIKTGLENVPIVGIQWVDTASSRKDARTLAIGYSSGVIALYKDESDEEPVALETNLVLQCLQWNHNGSILAAAGKYQQPGGSGGNRVKFYNSFGRLLYELKLPGQSLTGISWEGFSQRLAMSVDCYIYLAQVKHDHRWNYFCNTLAYHFTKKGKSESHVMFWDTKNNERYVKQVKELLAIASRGEHCILATRLDDTETEDATQSKYGLILCNALGTPVDSKYISIEPAFVAMTTSHVIAASSTEFLVWHYRTPKSRTTVEFTVMKKEVRDQITKLEDVMPGLDGVCCIAAGSSVTVFGTASGNIIGFTLPSLKFIGHISLAARPTKLRLNCDSTKLAVLDHLGVLRMIQMDSSSGIVCFGSFLRFERKDVWDMQWSLDNAELFAVMEKTRMYVFRNLDPEEPIVTAAHLCSFKDLEIIAVCLEDILKDPENPTKDFLVSMETKSLRDTRNLLEKVGTKEAQIFVEDNNHPRLWKLLAEYALQNLDLKASESSFVRCGDFASLQILQRLKKLPPDSALLKAEVAAYFGDYDEAEKLFLASDRRDLALALRRKLGDWTRISELQKGSASLTTDLEAKANCSKMGSYFADRYEWKEAAKYFALSEDYAKLAECYLHLEDYENLEQLATILNENDPLVPKIAADFAAVGLCDQAVRCYLKCHQTKAALETCCTLNQWNSAVTLSKEVQLPDISSRLVAHTRRVLDQDKLTDAVQLLRKANCFTEAAILLFQAAEGNLGKGWEPLKMKKLFVLAARLVEEQKTNKQESFALGQDKTSRFLETPWRGAEAFHLLILSQRHLQAGSSEAAMAAAYKLQDYVDILEPEAVFSLLALASAANKCFGVCSKAFIRLESLPKLSNAEREAYGLLAIEIFTRNPPKDGRSNKSECPQCHSVIFAWMPQCGECGTRFPTCMATGMPLHHVESYGGSSTLNCRFCKRSAAENEMLTRVSCPLCHSPVQSL